MTVKFHLLDAYDEIPRADRDAVLAALQSALPRVLERLPIDRVDVVVGYSDPFWTIPAYGIGGWSHGKGRVSITVAPDHPRFRDAERGERLAAVLAHELHHIMRSRAGGYGETLGEALVSEGLAQCFEVEIGCPPPPYAVAVTGEKLRAFAERARPLAAEKHYDHGAWFFGKWGDENFPKDGGYSLGYALVRAWLAEAGKTASSAVDVAARAVIEPWIAGRIAV
jgi:hypothetical protein